MRIFIIMLLGGMSIFTSNAQIAERELIKSVAGKNKTLILDVRTLGEYNQDHMIGTLNIPVDNLSDTSFYRSLRSYDNIIIVCKGGGRASKAKKMLEEQGFHNLYNGGGWKRVQEILAPKKEEEEYELPEIIRIR